MIIFFIFKVTLLYTRKKFVFNLTHFYVSQIVSIQMFVDVY